MHEHGRYHKRGKGLSGTISSERVNAGVSRISCVVLPARECKGPSDWRLQTLH